jgi:hypothetical protein
MVPRGRTSRRQAYANAIPTRALSTRVPPDIASARENRTNERKCEVFEDVGYLGSREIHLAIPLGLAVLP